MDIFERYNVKNKLCKKKCVYHIGIDAGFFSEYSSMINMILYCLEHHIQFKLYSKDANFGYKNGWTDYFEPFCEEVTDSFHHYCNFHSRQPLKRILQSRKEVEAPTLRWKIKLELLHLIGTTIRLFKRDFNYYTQDIADSFGSCKRNFNFPELNFSGNYCEAFSLIDSMIWKFNDQVKNSILRYKSELSLPSEYISCQIRGGDKFIEYDLYSVDIYINKLKQISNVRDVFVLTDDYSILQQLQEKAPDYRWHSLCQPSEKGYYNRAFTKLDDESKKNQMIRFLASIEIMKKSTFFLGSITTGPSCYIANVNYPNIDFVDLDPNQYIDILDSSFAQRRSIIKNYME